MGIFRRVREAIVGDAPTDEPATQLDVLEEKRTGPIQLSDEAIAERRRLRAEAAARAEAAGQPAADPDGTSGFTRRD